MTILVIRGHIRNSFDTKNLYYLIKDIYHLFPDLKIYIHTWSIFANNISWREVNSNYKKVDEDIIYDYFDDLKELIEHIIIDDDTKIKLIGNLQGNVSDSKMPLIGWKNYWYGKHKIIEYIYKKNIDENEMIVNVRFDVLNNSFSFDNNFIINFIKYNDIKFIKNIFLFNDGKDEGIDNIYIGNIKTMYKLTNKFFNELDDIISKNPGYINQEKLVYKLNSCLFE
jgi:F0F1-type ATP synthase delta subunit